MNFPDLNLKYFKHCTLTHPDGWKIKIDELKFTATLNDTPMYTGTFASEVALETQVAFLCGASRFEFHPDDEEQFGKDVMQSFAEKLGLGDYFDELFEEDEEKDPRLLLRDHDSE